MKTRVGIALVATFLLAGLPALYAADPVALVTDVKGNATMTERGKNSRLTVLTYLVPDTEIAIDGGGRMVVTFFAPPNEYAFVGPATIRIEQDRAKVLKGQSAEPRNLANEKAVAARNFARVQRERTDMATFEMRGTARPEMRLLGPVNTDIISRTPSFTWTTLPGISTYHWKLTERGGQTVKETDVEGGNFELPKDAPLQYGTTYNWKVDCKVPSGKTVWATGEFVLVDETRALKIDALRPMPEASFSEHLLFAVFLESEGFGFDAQKEWRDLVQERPDDATLRVWAKP